MQTAIMRSSIPSWRSCPGFEQIDQSKIGVKSFPGNQKPTASGVSVSGTAAVGKTLNAVYTFSDADGDSEGATVVNFYISENQNESFYLNWKKVSDNMSSTEFTVTPICEGKWIRCKVTPGGQPRRTGRACLV